MPLKRRFLCPLFFSLSLRLLKQHQGGSGLADILTLLLALTPRQKFRFRKTYSLLVCQLLDYTVLW